MGRGWGPVSVSAVAVQRIRPNADERVVGPGGQSGQPVLL